MTTIVLHMNLVKSTSAARVWVSINIEEIEVVSAYTIYRWLDLDPSANVTSETIEQQVG